MTTIVNQKPNSASWQTVRDELITIIKMNTNEKDENISFSSALGFPKDVLLKQKDQVSDLMERMIKVDTKSEEVKILLENSPDLGSFILLYKLATETRAEFKIKDQLMSAILKH